MLHHNEGVAKKEKDIRPRKQEIGSRRGLKGPPQGYGMRDLKMSVVRRAVTMSPVGSRSDVSPRTEVLEKRHQKMKPETIERRFMHKPEYLGTT